MSTAVALLAELQHHGIRVAAVGDKLRVTAAPGAVTADIRARLARHKPAIMQALSPPPPPPPAVALATCAGCAHVQVLQADGDTRPPQVGCCPRRQKWHDLQPGHACTTYTAAAPIPCRAPEPAPTANRPGVADEYLALRVEQAAATPAEARG